MESALDTEVTLSSAYRSCTFKLRDFDRAKLIRGGDIVELKSIGEISNTELSFNKRAIFKSSSIVIKVILFASEHVPTMDNILGLFEKIRECDFCICNPGSYLSRSDRDKLKMGIMNAIWFQKAACSAQSISYIHIENYEDGVVVFPYFNRDSAVVIRSNNDISKDIFISRMKEATCLVYDESISAYLIGARVPFRVILRLFEDVQMEHERKLLSRQNKQKSARN